MIRLLIAPRHLTIVLLEIFHGLRVPILSSPLSSCLGTNATVLTFVTIVLDIERNQLDQKKDIRAAIMKIAILERRRHKKPRSSEFPETSHNCKPVSAAIHIPVRRYSYVGKARPGGTAIFHLCREGFDRKGMSKVLEETTRSLSIGQDVSARVRTVRLAVCCLHTACSTLALATVAVCDITETTRW